MSPIPQARSKAPTAPCSALPLDTELRVTSSVTDTASAASSSSGALPSMERISEALDSDHYSLPTSPQSDQSNLPNTPPAVPAQNNVLLNGAAKASLSRMRARLLA